MKLQDLLIAVESFSADTILRATSEWDFNALPTEDNLSKMRSRLSIDGESHTIDTLISVCRTVGLHPQRWPHAHQVEWLQHGVNDAIYGGAHRYVNIGDFVSNCLETSNTHAISRILSLAGLKYEDPLTPANATLLQQIL